uniref:Cytochrome c biogenesis protein CcsA n=1 Tax=Pleurostichidium falkenbergii TaxID=121064 RepID=A0A4D6UY91_9FLOR|nr:cytochrome c biogenesis protein ccs1 [Pleurostichidium falkenbergii]QCH39618.1 cytochrome c biogenesis protein ccs1 [Pleurostichidium falkenbergii]
MNMNLIENNLINTSFGLLLVGLIIYWLNLIITHSDRINYLCISLIVIVNIMLASSLITRWICNKYFPLSNLYESLIFLAWSITLIQVILEITIKNRLIGAITTPTVLFIIAFTSFSLPYELKIASPLVPALKSNWLIMHVTVMIVSYATLMVGSLLSILFLVISNKHLVNIQGNSNNYSKKILFNYELNNTSQNIRSNHNEQQVKRINLMQSIDNLSYRIIGFGFPLLTVGIISGAVWANDAWGTYWSWDPKETWALITWIIFAIYLHSRLNKNTSGKRPAKIASLGFIIIWICYLGVNFLGKGLHSYGWLLS